MVRVIRHRIANYKFFNLDIWGILRSSYFTKRKNFSAVTNNFTKLSIINKKHLSNQRNLVSNLKLLSNNNFFIVKKNFNFIPILKFLKNLFIYKKNLIIFRFLEIAHSIYSLKKFIKLLSNFFNKFFNRFFNKKFIKSNNEITFDQFFFIANKALYSLSCKKSNLIYAKLFKSNTKIIFHKSNKLIRISQYFFKKYCDRMEYLRNKKKIYYYRFDVKNILSKKKKINKKFISLRLVKAYFITLTYRHFKKLGRKARKLEGFFEQNYLRLLECRIVSFIYRSTYMHNMFEIIRFVKSNNVWVNKCFIPYTNYIIPIMQFTGFRYSLKGTIFWTLLRRLRKRRILFNTAKYIFVSYIFSCFFLKRYPTLADLCYPIKVNIFRAIGYAH